MPEILTFEEITRRLDRWYARKERREHPDSAYYPCVCGDWFTSQRDFTNHIRNYQGWSPRRRLDHYLLVL